MAKQGRAIAHGADRAEPIRQVKEGGQLVRPFFWSVDEGYTCVPLARKVGIKDAQGNRLLDLVKSTILCGPEEQYLSVGRVAIRADGHEETVDGHLSWVWSGVTVTIPHIQVGGKGEPKRLAYTRRAKMACLRALQSRGWNYHLCDRLFRGVERWSIITAGVGMHINELQGISMHDLASIKRTTSAYWDDQQWMGKTISVPLERPVYWINSKIGPTA